MNLGHAEIEGVGCYLPPCEGVDALDRRKNDRLRSSLGDAFERSNFRHVAGFSDTSVAMGERAALDAFRCSRVQPAEIDLVLCASMDGDMQTPSDATLIAERVGIEKAAAIGIEWGCAGSMALLKLAEAFISSGMHKNILAIAIANWSGRCFEKGADTGPVSDAAGAFILKRSDQRHYLAAKERRYPAHRSAMTMKSPVATGAVEFMASNPSPEFAQFIRREPARLVNSMLAEARTPVSDVDWFIPNQPSARISQEWADAVGIPRERVVTTFHEDGNMAGATLPVLLRKMQSEDMIAAGQKAVFFSTATGFHLSSALWRF